MTGNPRFDLEVTRIRCAVVRANEVGQCWATRLTQCVVALRPTFQRAAGEASVRMGHEFIAFAQVPVSGEQRHQPEVITLLNMKGPFVHRANPCANKPARLSDRFPDLGGADCPAM